MKIKVYVVDVKLPRWARRVLMFGAVPAFLLGLGALVHAMTVEQFSPGEVLTAELLNGRFNAIAGNVPVVSTWKSYPVTVSTDSGTIQTSAKGMYRRVGDSVEVNLATDFTACTPTTGILRWSLPSGIKADVAKLAHTYARIGYGTRTPVTELLVYAQGELPYVSVDAVGETAGGMPCSKVPSGTSIRLSFSLPVAGWSGAGE